MNEIDFLYLNEQQKYHDLKEAFIDFNCIPLKKNCQSANFRVEQSSISIVESTKNELQLKIVRLVTVKRMTTKTQNLLKKYEKEQQRLLLPDFEFDKYCNTQRKHIEYFIEREQLVKEIAI